MANIERAEAEAIQTTGIQTGVARRQLKERNQRLSRKGWSGDEGYGDIKRSGSRDCTENGDPELAGTATLDRAEAEATQTTGIQRGELERKQRVYRKRRSRGGRLGRAGAAAI